MEIWIDPVSGRIEFREGRRNQPRIDPRTLMTAESSRVGVLVRNPLAPRVGSPS